MLLVGKDVVDVVSPSLVLVVAGGFVVVAFLLFPRDRKRVPYTRLAFRFHVGVVSSSSKNDDASVERKFTSLPWPSPRPSGPAGRG